MRKTSETTHKSERNGLRIVAALALAGSLAAFGCSTNKMPGNGEPAMSAPAAGSVAPNATSTPGSLSGTTPSNGGTPMTMISSSPAAGFSAGDDAIATLKADQAYRGRYLGQAAPNDNPNATMLSMQQQTGQFIPPSAYANPQVTVNSSISSPPTPAIVSGAGEGVGGATVAALPAGTAGITSGVVAAPAAASGATTGAIANGVANVGTTGMSNTTATGMTTATGALTVAPAASSNATATPILTTIGATPQANAAVAAMNAGGSTPSLTNGFTASTPRTNTAATTVAGTTGSGATVGVASPSSNTTATPMTNNATAALTNTTASATVGVDRPVTASRASIARRPITAGTTRASTATAAVHVETANGTRVMTNSSPSTFQRFLGAIGLRRTPMTAGSSNTNSNSGTTTTTPNQQ
ncbi:MAG TPA: hypothetical protein VF980_19420 [Thermoanaerobaculia bacterium]